MDPLIAILKFPSDVKMNSDDFTNNQWIQISLGALRNSAIHIALVNQTIQMSLKCRVLQEIQTFLSLQLHLDPHLKGILLALNTLY